MRFDVVLLFSVACLLFYVLKEHFVRFILIISFDILANLYTCIESWPDTKSLPGQLGEIGGLALNKANDELVVFHRGSRKWENK